SLVQLVEELLGFLGRPGLGELLDDVLEPFLRLVTLALVDEVLGKLQLARRVLLGLVGVVGLILGIRFVLGRVGLVLGVRRGFRVRLVLGRVGLILGRVGLVLGGVGLVFRWRGLGRLLSFGIAALLAHLDGDAAVVGVLVLGSHDITQPFLAED